MIDAVISIAHEMANRILYPSSWTLINGIVISVLLNLLINNPPSKGAIKAAMLSIAEFKDIHIDFNVSSEYSKINPILLVINPAFIKPPLPANPKITKAKHMGKELLSTAMNHSKGSIIDKARLHFMQE